MLKVKETRGKRDCFQNQKNQKKVLKITYQFYGENQYYIQKIKNGQSLKIDAIPIRQLLDDNVHNIQTEHRRRLDNKRREEEREEQQRKQQKEMEQKLRERVRKKRQEERQREDEREKSKAEYQRRREKIQQEQRQWEEQQRR